MLLRQIFDQHLAQYAYLIGCQITGQALIIDPERDIDRYKKLAADNGLRITAVAETHIHADFVSGACEFAQDPAIHLYLSAEGAPDWAYQWPKERPNTHFLKDKDYFMVGDIRIDAIHTPGHTPEHLCFLITDSGCGANEPVVLASGDFLFVGDVGRPDLLETAVGVMNVKEPSARQLQQSLIDKLKGYGDYLLILPAHGAGSACGKELGATPMSTLGYERRFNNMFKLAQNDQEAFVQQILFGQIDPPLYFATMKRVNREGIKVTGGVPTPLKLTPENFTLATKQPGVRILDTRDSGAAFNAGHIARSIYVPLHSPLFSNAAGSCLGENDPILLVVDHDEDLEPAIEQLYRIGFDQLKGWITAAEASKAGLLDTPTSRINGSEFNPQEARKEGEIIDVRMTSEYQIKHLEGALLLPYTRLKAHLSELPQSRKLFVHCASGKRAAIAASFLRAEGFDAVHVDGSVFSGKGHTKI